MKHEGQAPAARVLLIDDDHTLLRITSLSLSLDGFEVATTANGVEGLELASTQAFDAIVLDIQMPLMDGRTLFRELRRRGHKTPVLILSAYGAEQTRQELGAEAAVSKPFELDVLERALRKLVHASRTDDQAHTALRPLQ